MTIGRAKDVADSSRIAIPKPNSVLIWKRLYIKAKVHHIAFPNDVIPAF
jgi:hypothetical protein